MTILFTFFHHHHLMRMESDTFFYCHMMQPSVDQFLYYFPFSVYLLGDMNLTFETRKFSVFIRWQFKFNTHLLIIASMFKCYCPISSPHTGNVLMRKDEHDEIFGQIMKNIGKSDHQMVAWIGKTCFWFSCLIGMFMDFNSCNYS